MKSLPILSAALLLSLAAAGSSSAQTFVTESRILLTSTIYTQASDSITRTRDGGTLTTRRLVETPFTNRQVLEAMISRGLLAGVTSDWSLVYLQDESGAGGPYAKSKTTGDGAPAPVAVPSDLLTLPSFLASATRGTELTNARGTFVGETEIAYAECAIDGIPATGMASNGIRTLTLNIDGTGVQIDTVTTTMGLHGGEEGDPSDRLLKGVLTIGKATLSNVDTLP